MPNETWQLTQKMPHNVAGNSLAWTMELKIVSCSDYGYETKTDTSFIPSYFHLKAVYFLSHYTVTAGRLAGTKSFPAHQLATIFSFVLLRLKFNLLGRPTSRWRSSCVLKDIGYHQGGTFYVSCVSRQSSSSFEETWWCVSCIRVKCICA